MPKSVRFDFESVGAVVTGAASGIGFGIASAFREAGADIVLADIDEDGLAAVYRRLPDGMGRVLTVAADLTDREAPDRIAQRAAEEFGGVDVLVNCAGIYPSHLLPELTYEQFDRVLSLNLRAAIFMTKAIVDHMPTGGAVVNIASIEAFRPSFPGLTAYGASKGALLAATRELAIELVPKRIRVNAVCPGTVETDGGRRIVAAMGLSDEQYESMREQMSAAIPWGRMAQPNDIAPAVLFLASSAADYVTGSYIVVDGGSLLA
jgi:NAD(P)-dependent dehydrogenase (short-subunit alcohol dehydrogenase family)